MQIGLDDGSDYPCRRGPIADALTPVVLRQSDEKLS
jgi:hypothetical protein